MTNVNNPTGGKAVGSFNAARFDLKVNKYVTSTSDATPLYVNDAVKTTGTAAVDGTPVCAKALAGESIRGLVVAIEPLHTEENSVYRKASTERIIHVCDDPYIMLEIQTNGTLAITDIGKYANIVLNGGNDITGLSGTLVDLSSTSTDSRQLRIVSLVDRVDNEVGQYAKVRCVIHDHELAHGGTYTQENIWKRVGTTISPFNTGDDVDTLTGNLRVGGKLTVVGLIDPTGLLLEPQAAAPGTDDGMIYYDLPSNNFLFRENGAWHTLDDTGVWKRVTGTPNYLLPLVVADDIGATAARITKGWFADLEITNYPSVNGTALSDQYLATTNSPTFVGETLSGLSVLGGIVQTDGSGVLSSSITLPDGTLATTQSPLDNSTKLATTAYVDAAVVVEDLWDRAGTTLSPSTANDDVLITKSTSTATDYTLKTDTTLLADVDGVIGHISEMTAYASGMTGGKEIVAYEAILHHSTSDTNGQYIAYRAADFSTPYPSATSPSYAFWAGRDYDWGLYLESGRILINDDSPDIISCARETVGDGPSLTISAADGKSGGSPQDGGDFILRAGLDDGGTPGEIIFQVSAADVGKFNSDGKLELTSGTGINEIVTSISVASTDDQGATAKAVWDLHALTDTWNEVMHFGNTFTILDTENISATITQNDTTNNPAALIIANTGSGNDITLPNSSYIKNGSLVLGGDVGLTGTRITKGWFADLEITNMPTVSGTSINANAVLDLTSGEVIQLANIGVVSISAAQWGYLSQLDQGVASTDNPSFAGVVLTGLSVANGIVQTDGAGILSTSVTLPDGTLATTQSPLDNSTKLATTAYVDVAIGTVDSWDEVMHKGNTFTVLDTENISATITQNDTTNNPAALIIANTGSGNDITLPNSSYIKNGLLVLGGDVGLTGTRITKGWFTDLEVTNYPSVNGTALTNQYLATTDTPTFAQLTVDNLVLDGNTLSSTTGNINITPDNPTDHIIINSHWDFDGKTLVAISDSDTTLTAYAGKNITIEGTTFDGGVVAGISSLTATDLVATAGVDVGTTLTVAGGHISNVTTVDAATYDLLVTDYIVNVTYTSTGAVTSLTLPTAQTVFGRIIHIKDAGGNATTNTITIDTQGSEKIDGLDTFVITVDYNSVSFYSDGTNWFKF